MLREQPRFWNVKHLKYIQHFKYIILEIHTIIDALADYDSCVTPRFDEQFRAKCNLKT